MELLIGVKLAIAALSVISAGALLAVHHAGRR